MGIININYDNINFNCNLSKLQTYGESKGLILHAWNNTERKDSPELIHKEIQNKTLTDWRRSETYEKDLKLLKENPDVLIRFFATTFNLPYSKENEHIILEWGDRIKDYLDTKFNVLDVELHLNETSPHIHAFFLNMDPKREKIGNFNKYGEQIKLSGKYYINPETGEKVNLTPKKIKRLKKEDPDFFKKNKMGDYGKDTLEQIWKDGMEINRQICEKYGLKFEQKPTSEWAEKRKEKREKLKNLTIEEFRQQMKEENKNNSVYEKRINDLENENKEKDKIINDLKNDNKKKNEYILKDKKINNLQNEIEKLKAEKNEIDDFGNYLSETLGIKGKKITDKFWDFENKKNEKIKDLRNDNKILTNENKKLKEEIEQLKANQKKNEYQR